MGFQLGASFVPDDGDGLTDEEAAPVQEENVIGAGVNWTGALGSADLTVAAAGIIGDAETDGDDLESGEVGFLAGFGGLTFGAKAGHEDDLNEGDFANAGIRFGFGAARVSVGYVYNDPDGGETTHLERGFSADIGLMQGVTLQE